MANFKSDKQRKAVMAQLNKNNSSNPISDMKKIKSQKKSENWREKDTLTEQGKIRRRETNSPQELAENNLGVYITDSVGGNALDRYMQDDLDLKNQRDYEYVINQRLNGEEVGVLFLMSNMGAGRWESSLGMKGFSKTSVKELKEKRYELFM